MAISRLKRGYCFAAQKDAAPSPTVEVETLSPLFVGCHPWRAWWTEVAVQHGLNCYVFFCILPKCSNKNLENGGLKFEAHDFKYFR